MKLPFYFVSPRASMLTPYTVFFGRYLTPTLAVTISFLYTKYILHHLSNAENTPERLKRNYQKCAASNL